MKHLINNPPFLKAPPGQSCNTLVLKKQRLVKGNEGIHGKAHEYY